MSGYDPARHKTYGDYLKAKGVRANFGGLSRTERVIDEGHLSNGERYQTRQDELGNRTRERSDSPGVSTAQDVVIRAPHLSVQRKLVVEEQQ